MMRFTSRSHPAAMKPSRSRSVSWTRPIKRRRRWSLSVRHCSGGQARYRADTQRAARENGRIRDGDAGVQRGDRGEAYVEAARNTTDMTSSHIEAVRAAMNAVAHEGAPTAAHHVAIPYMRQALQ